MSGACVIRIACFGSWLYVGLGDFLSRIMGRDVLDFVCPFLFLFHVTYKISMMKFRTGEYTRIRYKNLICVL